ncbi:P-loop containing nucleoside triphosphate hydrolase protein [Naematelia encephala]|uniref:RNA helicase n=1 Tax=Naematelia encephala TaxID=71784 RepID=A0A1Y2BM60_9TREE|nr:P-loop containing nucleoside triphosphate hydrolase protein [Naematelia encephala]
MAEQAQAGPSTPSRSRVANFDDSSSEDFTPTPSAKSVNGSPQKKRKISHVNGAGPSKRTSVVKGTGDNDESKRRRKEIADELFEVRQNLPFYQGRRQILEEIMANDTTIIIGETGCGKSTQLPQLLRTHSLSLDHYGANDPHASRFTRGPSIAVTQPRRLPAIALANRVAAEMGCVVGGEVGYSVRFEDVTGRGTRVRYLTEGVLMRELANPDPTTTKIEGGLPTPVASRQGTQEEDEGNLNLLLRYDIVVIDEAHERTLNTDFLCGALKRIQKARKRLAAEALLENGERKQQVKELKIVVMSATLDPGKFQRFFETGRQALLVKGRMFSVATSYTVDPIDDFIEQAARKVMQIHCTKPAKEGDVLVFMPGAEEIENCCEVLRRAAIELPEGHMQLQILPLYSSLPPAAQAKIFAPTAKNTRRIIVATNIAETSMTIPGVSFVVDSGYKKEKEYIFRPSGAIEHLAKKPVSKASAWQRTGRAGRERAGECYRLFTQKAFDMLDPFDAPEIQRCNLSSAVLQLVAMGLNPFTFDYIDHPGRDPIAAAFQTLAGLGALDSPTSITPLGREMLRFPLDPEHARILIASFSLGCPSEIIDILSLINTGPVWVDRVNDRDAAAAARARFLHRDGDHLTAMNVLREYIDLKSRGDKSLARWCRDNYVNQKTLTAAIKVRDQLRELAEREGRDWRVSCGNETEVVVRSLLQGLFMNTAVIQSDGSYRQTAGPQLVKIHPSSVLMSKKVPAILYDELAITTSVYARNVSSFDQHWLSEIPWFKQAGLAVAQSADKTRL